MVIIHTERNVINIFAIPIPVYVAVVVANGSGIVDFNFGELKDWFQKTWIPSHSTVFTRYFFPCIIFNSVFQNAGVDCFHLTIMSTHRFFASFSFTLIMHFFLSLSSLSDLSSRLLPLLREKKITKINVQRSVQLFSILHNIIIQWWFCTSLVW